MKEIGLWEELAKKVHDVDCVLHMGDQHSKRIAASVVDLQRPCDSSKMQTRLFAASAVASPLQRSRYRISVAHTAANSLPLLLANSSANSSCDDGVIHLCHARCTVMAVLVVQSCLSDIQAAINANNTLDDVMQQSLVLKVYGDEDFKRGITPEEEVNKNPDAQAGCWGKAQ
eukprot:14463-Heterococcus_DN1.PRE.1